MMQPRPASMEAHAVRAQASPDPISVVVLVTERPHDLAWLYRTYAPPFREDGRAFEFVFTVEARNSALTDALEPLIEAGEPIRIIEVGQSVGESALLDAARATCAAPILVTLPAYPRVEPDALGKLVALVDGGVDMASAARRTNGLSIVNRSQSRIFHAILRRLASSRFRDVASGVRAMKRSVLEEIPLYGDFCRFLPVLAEWQGFEVVEVEVATHPEDRRTRVYSLGVYLRRMVDLLGLFFLMRFTQKPLRFFGLVGALLSIAGGAILCTLFVERLGGHDIADRPMLLLGTLLFVLGVQSIAMGLLGEMIVLLSSQRRRAYRLRESPGHSPGVRGGA